MKKHNLSGIFYILFIAGFVGLSGCNKNEETISSEQIRQALFDMKGTYHGSAEASYYHGENIATIENALAVSRDSLIFKMPLGPMADAIKDEQVAAALRRTAIAEVRAGYEFLQIDDSGYFVNYLLLPKSIIIPAQEDTPEITIVFSDIFGGNFEKASNFTMFNISPKEMLVNGKKLDSFRQLVYHFRRTYE